MTLAESMAPPVRRWRRLDDVGVGPRSASTSGRAKASPTISSDVTRSALDRVQHVDGVEADGVVLDDDGAPRRSTC